MNCKPQPYQILMFSYQPSIKKGLYENRKAFYKKLVDYQKKHDPNYTKNPKWMIREFFEYWSATDDNGRKMYFEKEKRWNTGLRLSTWRKNASKDPRWKEQKQKVYVPQKRKERDYEPILNYDNYKPLENVGRGNIGTVIKNKMK